MLPLYGPVGEDFGDLHDPKLVTSGLFYMPPSWTAAFRITSIMNIWGLSNEMDHWAILVCYHRLRLAATLQGLMLHSFTSLPN